MFKCLEAKKKKLPIPFEQEVDSFPKTMKYRINCSFVSPKVSLERFCRKILHPGKHISHLSSSETLFCSGEGVAIVLRVPLAAAVAVVVRDSPAVGTETAETTQGAPGVGLDPPGRRATVGGGLLPPLVPVGWAGLLGALARLERGHAS